MKPNQYKILRTDMLSVIRKLSLYCVIFFSFSIGFNAAEVHAQGINWLWATGSYGGYLNSAESLVIDPSGNSYVTGSYSYASPNYSFDLGNGISLVGFGAFIAKYNSAGDCLWAKQLGDTSTVGTSISIDDAGNIYSTGTFEGTRDFDPGSGIYNLTSAGSTDIYISKLNASGDFVWAKRIGGPLADGNFRSCLTINPDDGEMYITGYFKGTSDFDPGAGVFNLTSAGGDDIFISSLDASGNFLWADRIGGSGADVAKSIARDDDGDLITTGKFTGTVDFNPGGGTFNLTGGGTFISKLSGTGGFTFAKKIGNDIGNAITADASNNIYTTGMFSGTADFDPGPGEFNLTADGTDFFISKLDASGNFIWAVGVSGVGYAEANSIAVDDSGNVFTTGFFVSLADFDPGPNIYWVGGLGIEVFILKLDASGNFVFAEGAGGEDDAYGDIGNYVAIDNNGTALITGTYDWGYFYIGPFILDYNGFDLGTYIFIAKFGTEATEPLDVSIISYSNVLCYGQSTGSATAEASGGYPPFSYAWSNGASGAELQNVSAGTYTVTVTDNVGSSATTQIVINQPAALAFAAPLISHVSCNSGSDGSIQVSVTGGVSPYSYAWSNGDSGPSISNLIAGTYTVSITDSNDCTKSASYEIEQPDLIEINLVYLNHETCFASNDGEISISISGGTNPFNAVWSNGNTGMTISGLAPGEYTVTITDNNDCTQTSDYVIQPGIPVEVSLVEIHHVSCAGGADGSISVVGSSGIPPYEYFWSNGEIGSTIDSLVSELYSVTATDDNGCFGITDYLITQPSVISIEIVEQSQNLCYGDSVADLTAIVSGGVSPYTGLWSNGVTGLENSNLAAGSYMISVTDANGCTSMASDTLTDPPIITVNLVSTNETSSGANDGTAIANPMGGVPPFSFLWNSGDTLSSRSGLSPGIYMLTITDANGCSAEGTAVVNPFGCTLDISLSGDISICETDTISIQPTIMMGSGVLSYVWSDGSTGETLSVSHGGDYCVTITDSSNCQDLDCIEISEISIPMFTCPVTNESAPGANDGSVYCDSLPGIITYAWSNGASTSSISGLSPGDYCLTVTEQNGCTSSQCFYVQPGNCLMVVNNVFITDILCAGDTTGAIAVTIENGTEPLTYTWSNGGTTDEIKDLSAGTYALTVSDASGCEIYTSFTIADPPPISVVIDSIAMVDGSGSGLIWITAAGGTPDYTFLWVDPIGGIITTEDLNNLTQSGYYSLLLTDAVGCHFILDSVYVDQEVALNSFPSYQTLKVYPVPAKDVLYINMDRAVTEVRISGIDGRLCKTIFHPVSNQLDLSDLDPAWYVVRVNDGVNWKIARIIKL